MKSAFCILCWKGKIFPEAIIRIRKENVAEK